MDPIHIGGDPPPGEQTKSAANQLDLCAPPSHRRRGEIHPLGEPRANPRRVVGLHVDRAVAVDKSLKLLQRHIRQFGPLWGHWDDREDEY